MKKGMSYVGIVRNVDFPNKGRVEFLDGEQPEQAVVKGVLPGQKIEFVLKRKRNGVSEGRLKTVLESAPMELPESHCVHSSCCGGCAYQTLPYEMQLEIKKDQVKKLLDPVCGDYEFEGILPSPVQDGYRNKMEYSFGDEYKDGPLALGLHKKGSMYDIVPVTQCQIVHPDYCKVLQAVISFFQERAIPFLHKMTHQGYLRHLLVRRSVKNGSMTVNLVTTTQWDPKEREDMDRQLVQILLELPLSGSTITGITHIYNDSLADVVQSDQMEVLYGQDYLQEEILGLNFKISTFSFFQTNSLGAEVLYQKARDYIGDTKGKVIFDLYSGTGTIAQILAPVAKSVTGVEIVEEAVEAARENARANGLENCTFIAGDVLKVLDELCDIPDLIVLDPPREGIHPKAIKKIAKHQVDRIIYISCKPTSLARDIVELAEYGYKVDRVCCVDMFPGTVHVEVVCLLSKLHEKRNIEVELEMSELDLTVEESKASYEEIKDYVLEHMGESQ